MESLTSLATAAATTTVSRPKVSYKKHKLVVKSLSDPDNLTAKLLFFGGSGTGKTYVIVYLLLAGYKVFVLSTDFGGNGLMTVRNELRRMGREELLLNCSYVDLDDYETILSFLENPEESYPGFFDQDIDFLFWDGFSSFTISDVSEYIGANLSLAGGEDGGGKKTELRESGFQFEPKDYVAKNAATLRAAKKFLALHNRKTGKIWHKVLTCLEEIRPKKKTNSDPTKGSEYVDQRKPLLSGQAGIISHAGFDLIVRTSVSSQGEDDGRDDGARTYEYALEGNKNLAAKTRGFKLPPTMKADFSKLWDTICEQSGIVRNAVKAEVIERDETKTE